MSLCGLFTVYNSNNNKWRTWMNIVVLFQPESGKNCLPDSLHSKILNGSQFFNFVFPSWGRVQFIERCDMWWQSLGTTRYYFRGSLDLQGECSEKTGTGEKILRSSTVFTYSLGSTSMSEGSPDRVGLHDRLRGRWMSPWVEGTGERDRVCQDK